MSNSFATMGNNISTVSIGGTGGTGLMYQYVLQGPDSFAAATMNMSKKRVGPKLYFSYVKSKLTKTQTKKLKARLQKLQALVKNADLVGQKALYETLSKMLVVAVRESEAAACGYDVFINYKDVTKFMGMVTEDDTSHKNPVFFKKLEEFPRALPAKIQKTVKAVQSKGLFDELWVLYLDYSGEEIKSTKEKIREKDPILFGKFSYDDQRLYFVADWVDEYCDLTLSKFVDEMKQNDGEYETSTVEEITPEYLDRIREEIKERDIRMKNVHSQNYRDKMAEEDQAEIKRLREENTKLQENKSADRAKWRKEANQELREIAAEKDQELSTKKPWYKRFF